MTGALRCPTLFFWQRLEDRLQSLRDLGKARSIHTVALSKSFFKHTMKFFTNLRCLESWVRTKETTATTNDGWDERQEENTSDTRHHARQYPQDVYECERKTDLVDYD